MTDELRITAVTCVRDEGPFLLEWIAFHRLIGVTDFLVYSNDCSDGTDGLLDALARLGVVHHLPNPARGRQYQMEALRAARDHPLVRDADWTWIADADEFLNIACPGHRISDLVAACGDPQAISLSYRYFANGGVQGFRDLPVTRQFTRTHNPDIWCGEMAIEVKSLVRRDFPLRYFGAHRPFLRRGTPAEPAWTDGSGRPVDDTFRHAVNRRRIHRFPARGARDFASVNHYALRARDSYLVKIERGDVNRANRRFDAVYWQDRNDGVCEDRSILRHDLALAEAMGDLLSHPAIRRHHETCVRRHAAAIDRLTRRPDIVELCAALDALPPLPQAEAALLHALEQAP